MLPELSTFLWQWWAGGPQTVVLAPRPSSLVATQFLSDGSVISPDHNARITGKLAGAISVCSIDSLCQQPCLAFKYARRRAAAFI